MVGISVGIPNGLRNRQAHNRAKGGGFNLAAWEAAQINGFKFDYTKTDRNFQEANGPAQVSAVDQLIRLSLSDRLWGGQTLEQYLAGQPELAVNGEFAADLSSWSQANTGASNWTWDNGVARANTNGVDNARLRQAVPVVAGRSYFVTYGGTLAEGAMSVGTTTGGADLLAFGGRNRVFTATTNTAHLNFVTNGNGATLDNVTVKEVSRAAATQATTSLAPKWDPTLGAKWDGVDDRQLTALAPSAGNNLLIVKTALPATWTTLRIIAGARGSADTRFYIGFDSNSIVGAVGAQGPGLIRPPGPPDLRGQAVLAGLANNGSQVRLFLGTDKVYEGAQSGAVNTSVPLAIGGFNDNGTPGFFFDGSTSKVALYHTNEFVDTDLFRNIAANF